MDDKTQKPPEEGAGVGELGGFGSSADNGDFPQNNAGQSDNALPPKEEVPPTPPANPIVAGIAARLGGEGKAEEATESGIKPSQPFPFDLTKLSLEQIQNLKEVLNAAPERMKRKIDKPVVELKHVNGAIVVGMKQSFLAIVDDPILQKKVEKHIVPVLLQGSTGYVNMRLQEFRKLPMVEAEILSTRTEDDSYIEGEVFSAERKVMVEMLVKKNKYFFTVKVKGRADAPFEIEGEMANA
jgi:hypothetical protein